jgi:uncharacterized protein (PEP-CTERM system associated)
MGLATVSLAFPAAGQTTSPSISGPTVVAPSGPAIGGTLTGPPGPGGFPGIGGPGAILSPDARARLGGIGFPFDNVSSVGAAGGPGVRQPGLTFIPSIGIEQEYNDNVGFTADNKQDDFITRIRPGLLMNVDTQRLQGTLNYSPSIDFYWNGTSDNGISHFGNGQFLGTIVPDLLFIDVRGAAGVRSLSGGSSDPNARSSVGRQDQVQTVSFSVSPYLVQRFGGWASARTGYVYSYVNENRVDPNASLVQQPGQLPFSFTPSEYSSHQGYLVLRSGENFGPLLLQGSISGTTFEGSGLYEGAYKNAVTLETAYAFTRTVAGLVEIGYEDQFFNTVPQTDITGVTWAFGTRLTPTPESLIIAKYGRRDGFDSFFLNGSLELGVRTRLFANYSEKLTTSALSAGDLLNAITLDPLGNPVDAQTGAPVIPAFASSTLGTQSGLFREKAGTATISQNWLRDTFSFSVSQTDRSPVADAPGQSRPGFAQKSTNFTFTWGHDVAETTRLTSFLSYGFTTSGVTDDGNNYGAGIVLTHQINPALAGSLAYRLNIRDGGGVSSTGQPLGDDRAIQNVIVAGLRQSF